MCNELMLCSDDLTDIVIKCGNCKSRLAVPLDIELADAPAPGRSLPSHCAVCNAPIEAAAREHIRLLIKGIDGLRKISRSYGDRPACLFSLLVKSGVLQTEGQR